MLSSTVLTKLTTIAQLIIISSLQYNCLVIHSEEQSYFPCSLCLLCSHSIYIIVINYNCHLQLVNSLHLAYPVTINCRCIFTPSTCNLHHTNLHHHCYDSLLCLQVLVCKSVKSSAIIMLAPSVRLSILTVLALDFYLIHFLSTFPG